MGETAADGAAVAHGAIGDAGGDLDQHRAAIERAVGVLDRRMRHRGTDAPGVARVLDRAQLLETGYVDQEPGPSEAQIEHWPQRLPAGERLGAALALRQ